MVGVPVAQCTLTLYFERVAGGEREDITKVFGDSIDHDGFGAAVNRNESSQRMTAKRFLSLLV